METPDPQLKMLFDYTLFHIGLYTTLVTVLFGLLTFGHEHKRVTPSVGPLKWTVVFFLCAGLAGGAIGSNIPHYRDFASYSNATLYAFGFIPLGPYSWLEHVEHIAFWLGILFATVAFLKKK
jgi:hypothetical protein